MSQQHYQAAVITWIGPDGVGVALQSRSLVEQLNVLGQAGWEAFGVSEVVGDGFPAHHTVRVTLKRAVT
jgi:hypothetical protein